jgi:hypothetical protein
VGYLERRFRSDYTEQCRRFLVEETEAFLNGRLAGLVDEGADPAPAWVEINWIVHGPPPELLEAGRAQPRLAAPRARWAWVRATLLQELLEASGDDLAAIADRQRRCLVPLELELMTPARRWASPLEVAAAGTARLRWW